MITATDADRRQRFEGYVAPEIPFLLRVCQGMSGSVSEAEDLAQDVLLRSYRAIDRFDGGYPRAWLYRIARNCAISRTRRRDPVELVADPDRSSPRWAPDTDRGPEAEVMERGLDALLEQALDDLSPQHRMVVDLVDVHGLRYEEAAAALEIPVGTVMSRLHRARRRLRHALKGTHLDRAATEIPDAIA
jgi:RNA polymerase sigma-70 factor (ECF subfamily)